MSVLLQVTQQIDGANRTHDWYPLLPGDVLTRNPDGSYMKQTGLCISGFVLTDEQAATLVPVDGYIVLSGSL